MNSSNVDPIDSALREDIGEGDVTTDSFVPRNTHGTARIVARERAIVAGTKTAAEVFRRVDSALQVKIIRKNSSEVDAGDDVIEIKGSARSILKAERVALNFLQRLSGISPMTRKFVDAAASEHVKILDTRKTTPGLRALEKAAVVAGGGGNHRFGLFDMGLVKDNHLAGYYGFAAFPETLRNLRRENPGIRIEIEADSLEQVRTFLQIDHVDVILLDNMKPAQIR